MIGRVVPVVLALLGQAVSAGNGDDAGTEVLRGLFADPPRAEAFSDAFRAAVPQDEVQRILRALGAEIGPVEQIVPDGEGYLILTRSHRLRATITLDAEGRIAGLFFEPPEPVGQTLQGALDALRGFPAEIAYRIERDGALLAKAGEDAPVPVGSAFKLGILAELLASGRDLSDVVTLEARHKSLPTGSFRALPDGAPVTLYIAAAAMIADSDNTATDLLLEVVGPDAVAARLGVDRVLGTREFFVLKADPDLQAAFAAEPVAALAEAASRPLPTTGAVSSVTHRDFPGWPTRLSRLCDAIAAVADHPIAGINPGPVTRSDWDGVAFKGGSEPGVLALVHHLTDAAGHRHCAAVAFAADEILDEAAAIRAWRGVLSALASDPGLAR